MRRGGKVEDIRWFKNDASFVFHPMNTYNVGDIITGDVSEYGQAPLFPNVDGSAGSKIPENRQIVAQQQIN
jgi:carotenoid cleavage dioxygenase-like enzyme